MGGRCFAAVLGPSWGSFGAIVGPSWSHLGAALGASRGRFRLQNCHTKSTTRITTRIGTWSRRAESATVVTQNEPRKRHPEGLKPRSLTGVAPKRHRHASHTPATRQPHASHTPATRQPHFRPTAAGSPRGENSLFFTITRTL